MPATPLGFLDASWTASFVPNDGVRALKFGSQCALFSEARQELVGLNETAAYIWSCLEDGLSPARTVRRLEDEGVDRSWAGAYVDDALSQWLHWGWLYPASLNAQLDTSSHQVRLAICDIGFELNLYGVDVATTLLPFVEPLRGDAPVRCRLDIAGWCAGVFMSVDRSWQGFYSPDGIVPALKAALTGKLSELLRQGFLAHAALLETSSARILLHGASGSGKSTISLALALKGFRCLSDDIVHVDAAANMVGAPFPATLKEGAWPLVPGSEGLPTHVRADEQRVRYLPAAISHDHGRAPDIFITLDRSPHATQCLRRLPALTAMQMLLEGAFAPAGMITGAQLAAVAQTFQRMRCYSLTFSRLEDAVSSISDVANEEG